jgi:hypothetical protein
VNVLEAVKWADIGFLAAAAVFFIVFILKVRRRDD